MKNTVFWEEGNSKSSLRGKINKSFHVLQIKNKLLTFSYKHCVFLNAVFALRKPCGCAQDWSFDWVLRALVLCALLVVQDSLSASQHCQPLPQQHCSRDSLQIPMSSPILVPREPSDAQSWGGPGVPQLSGFWLEHWDGP